VNALRDLLAAGADVNQMKKGRETLFGIRESSGIALMAAALAPSNPIVRP
jgi:hypothetical protein